MTNHRTYIFLSIFLGLFVALVWIYPTDNTLFQISVTGIFSSLAIYSIMVSRRMKKAMDQRPFKIRHGRNKCDERRVINTGGNIDFEFTFTPQHSYYLATNPRAMNQHVNKLIGISSIDIHDQSVRIGWRNTKNNRFSLFVYYYQDGKRHTYYLTNVKPGEKVIGRIVTASESVAVNVNGYGLAIANMPKDMDWMTFPYFGGKHPAPWDMEFDIKFTYHGK